MNRFFIYCDESCHLEHDHEKVMVLGALSCRVRSVNRIADRLRHLKAQHGIPPWFDMKWAGVSNAKIAFYAAAVDLFFATEDLEYRAILVPDKSLLNHSAQKRTHDDFYYDMYFELLKGLLDPRGEYRVFLDMKDTRSAEKTRRLKQVLAEEMASRYRITRRIVTDVELVRSHHVQQIQLADLLTGAVAYAARELRSNAAKLSLVTMIQELAGHSLVATTLPRERKVNILRYPTNENANSPPEPVNGEA
jgi:hypothetical protein